jgi:HK97 family phage major capsid protein
MSKTAKELRAQAEGIAVQMEDITNNPGGENGTLTKEQNERWDKLDKDYDNLEQSAKTIERTAQIKKDQEERKRKEEFENGEELEERGEKPRDNSKELKERRESIWTKYMLTGMTHLNNEERQILQGSYESLTPEMRALTTQTDASGGYTIPEGFSNKIAEGLKAFGGMREVATVMSTDSGNDIPWPTNDDTGNKGALIAENTQVGEQDISFGSETLKAHTYTSKMIRVPIQLLQDSAFNLNTYLPGKLAERIARATNEHFTVGDGSSKPTGIVVDSALGVTAASATAITFDELIDLEHSIDPSYRNSSGFMFNDSTLKILKKIKDGDGNYIWKRGDVQGSTPGSILGYNYTVNQDMASAATGTKSVLFGALGNYQIRDVNQMVVLRLAERYADYFQVAFVLFSRHDGKLIEGNASVKHLIQA